MDDKELPDPPEKQLRDALRRNGLLLPDGTADIDALIAPSLLMRRCRAVHAAMGKWFIGIAGSIIVGLIVKYGDLVVNRLMGK